MKIIALTSCCVDVFPGLGQVYVGGNSLNVATQCKLSGVDDVSVIGGIGSDAHGTLVKNHLDSWNINSHHLYRLPEPTASNQIYLDAKGDRFFKEDSWQGGAFDAFRLSEKDWELVEGADIVAMPAGDPNLSDLLRKRQQQLVVVDFLDYLPLEFMASHLEQIDIAFISAKEEMLGELQTLSSESGTMVIATLGENGSVAFHENQRIIQGAIPAEEVIDTTGCGDAFQSAFFIEWYNSKNLPRSLFAGATAAKEVLGYHGGVQPFPTTK